MKNEVRTGRPEAEVIEFLRAKACSKANWFWEMELAWDDVRTHKAAIAAAGLHAHRTSDGRMYALLRKPLEASFQRGPQGKMQVTGDEPAAENMLREDVERSKRGGK